MVEQHALHFITNAHVYRVDLGISVNNCIRGSFDKSSNVAAVGNMILTRGQVKEDVASQKEQMQT
jgi:hypothetical protein